MTNNEWYGRKKSKRHSKALESEVCKKLVAKGKQSYKELGYECD